MAKPKALVLRAAGSNCDQETGHAFEVAGARTEYVHINRLLDKPDLLEGFQILAVPGGFTYGDDIAAGKILANQMVNHLCGPLKKFVDRGRLVLGICNGFQVLVKTGLLPGWDSLGRQSVTLTNNDSNKFECRWVHLESAPTRCVFFPRTGRITLPVAHAEGKFVAAGQSALKRLADNRQIVFRYVAPDGSPPGYPHNPNGSQMDIAAITDTTGRVLGMMPHPERHVRPQQHPRWTRGEANPVGDGLALFADAVKYFTA